MSTSILSLGRGSLLVTGIVSVCISSSLLFVSSSGGVLSLFGLGANRVVGREGSINRSQGRCVSVYTISKFKRRLFTLSEKKQGLLRCSGKLGFVASVPLSFVPLSFRTIPGNFLFSQLSMPRGKGQCILVSLSNRGRRRFMGTGGLKRAICARESFTSSKRLKRICLRRPVEGRICCFSNGGTRGGCSFMFRGASGCRDAILESYFLASGGVVNDCVGSEGLCCFVCSGSNGSLGAKHFSLGDHVPFSPVSPANSMLST